MKENLYDLLSEIEKSKVIIKSYKADQIIFHEQDKCEYISIVKKGHIKISSYTYNGNEIVYRDLIDNDIFGNNLIFSSYPYYRGNVISKTDSTIYFISKKELLNILKNNDEFLISFLRREADGYMELNQTIKVLSFENLEERFLYFLEVNNKKVEFSSITSLSSKLRVRRESLSRLISKLVKEGRIIKKDHLLILK